jgi:hypothetical protein
MPCAKGKYKPKNPGKYRGDVSNIIFRSSWELKLFKRLDRDPNVLMWASEEIAIRYIHPLDGMLHRYFPDVLVVYKDLNGNQRRVIIEVKPAKERVPPVQPERRTKKFLLETVNYAINNAKWLAATAFAKANGFEFKIMDEYDLGIKRRPKT